MLLSGDFCPKRFPVKRAYPAHVYPKKAIKNAISRNSGIPAAVSVRVTSGGTKRKAMKTGKLAICNTPTQRGWTPARGRDPKQENAQYEQSGKHSLSSFCQYPPWGN
jgi:hypothetical protein